MQLLHMPQGTKSSPIFPVASGAGQPAPRPNPYRPAVAQPRPSSCGALAMQPRAAAQHGPPPAPVPEAADPDLPRDVASRFGRRVRALRQARCMTQVEVAVHFGIDRTFISDVERGRKSVCLPTMEIFALGFGLSLSDLLRGI